LDEDTVRHTGARCRVKDELNNLTMANCHQWPSYSWTSLLTIVSFFVARTTLVWQPSIPVALAVLAIAQMGVHLVFFLHITTGPDNVNNVMALAFGVLIVLLVITGSLWIMAHMNHNMMPMDQIMQMQH
jgi:cytochrome o ubiquinol oxidase subunit IV